MANIGTLYFGLRNCTCIFREQRKFSSTRHLKTHLFLISERGLFLFLFNFWKSGGRAVTDTSPGPFTSPQMLRGSERPSRKQDLNSLLQMRHLGTRVINEGHRVGPRMLWERSRITEEDAAVEDVYASGTRRTLQTWPSHEKMPLNP